MKTCYVCHEKDAKISVSWGFGTVLLHKDCMKSFFDSNPSVASHDLLTLSEGEEYKDKRFAYPPVKMPMGKYGYKVGCANCDNEELTWEEEGSLERWKCKKCEKGGDR